MMMSQQMRAEVNIYNIQKRIRFFFAALAALTLLPTSVVLHLKACNQNAQTQKIFYDEFKL